MRTLLTITGLTIILSAACRNEPVKTADPEIINVKVTSVEQRLLSIPVHSSGIVASAEEMRLSFKTGGIIGKIAVKEGDQVKKGVILATLNLSEINAQVNLATSGYEKALRDYTRAKNLYADSVATLEQVQNAGTAFNMAKSNLEIARFNLSHSKIYSPDNGKILKQFARTNEIVSAGYPVFLFGTSGESWKIKAGVSDRDIIKINPGDSATVKVDAYPEVKFTAYVEQVGGISNPMTGTYEIELALDNAGYRLAAGFIASIEVFPSQKSVFLPVPVGSIVEANGQSGYVYVVTDSMEAKKIKVDIVTIRGFEAVIKTNSELKEEVVSEGAAYLRDGVKVKIVRKIKKANQALK